MRSARALRISAVGGLLVVLIGCGLDPSPAPSSAPPSASSQPTLVATPARSLAGSPDASAEADPGLFALIGGDASELDFRYDPDTTGTVGADPGVAADATGIAIGLYTVRGQQPIQDYGIVSILQLRDPSRDGEWFRSYRDSYDESACAQAGGIARHSQTVLNGHTVFIGGCAGGAFTYHVRVRENALVVSITSVGPADLGVRLMGDVDRP
jgi:hypothetical protein